MKKIVSLLFISTLTAGISSAQNKDTTETDKELKTVKKIAVRDFYIQSGFVSWLDEIGSLNDFKILAPQSDLLKSNFTTYTSGSGKGFSFESNAVISIMIGINLRDKEKTKYKVSPQLRVGFSYFNAVGLTYNIFQNERKPADTLISGQTGKAIYIDSVFNKDYNLRYSSNQLRFDCSLLFKTDPKARWSFYSGVGFNAGIALNAQTFIHYFETKGTGEAGQSVYSSSQVSFTHSDEKFNNKRNFGFSAYVPMGIDFRIGRSREFWRRMHLFYEFRPGVNFVTIPELRTITTAGVQHGFGLRFSLD